jgi:hypothetical protein
LILKNDEVSKKQPKFVKTGEFGDKTTADVYGAKENKLLLKIHL